MHRGGCKSLRVGESTRQLNLPGAMPGVLLNECNKEFLDIYYNSDIVISKGQGNYETLWDSNCGRGIYFLLKVKCTVLSQIMGIDLGQYVFKYREEKVLP